MPGGSRRPRRAGGTGSTMIRCLWQQSVGRLLSDHMCSQIGANPVPPQRDLRSFPPPLSLMASGTPQHIQTGNPVDVFTFLSIASQRSPTSRCGQSESI